MSGREVEGQGVEEELEIRPGRRAVRVTFSPEAGDSGGRTLTFDGTVQFGRGRVVLITNDGHHLVAR